MQLLTFQQMKARGVPFCRVHLMRLVKAKRFPSPIRIGQNRIVWDADEVDRHLQRLAAQRDTKPVQ